MGHLILALIGISLAASMFLRGRTNVTNEVLESEGICKTVECLQIANDLLNSMNQSVEPCDNFYDFACGNWEFHNPYPGYGYIMDGLGKLTRLARARLRDELENESSGEEILPVQQIKNLYKSCIAITDSEKLNLISAILNKIHGWSIIMEPGTWNSSAITWQEIDRYYEELMGLNAFYHLDIADHPSKHGVLQISMGIDGYFSEPAFILHAAVRLRKWNKIKSNRKKVRNEVYEMKDLAEQLSKVPETGSNMFFSNTSEFMNWWNTNINSSDAQNNLDWQSIFQRLLNIRNLSLTEDTPILLRNPAQFKELPKILASTDKRIISNFVHAQFIIKILITSAFKLASLYGAPRWDNCLNDEEPAVAHLFLKKYYGSDIKAAAEEIVKNIRESFEFQITDSNWMPYDLEEAAKQKVRNLKFVVGHEDWYMNETALIDYYKDLTLSDNYLENGSHLRKIKWERVIKDWGKPVEFKEWMPSVLHAGGEAFLASQTIYLSAALLQSPVLGQNILDYSGYAGGGFAAGHEIGHFLTDAGLRFLKVGTVDANVTSIFNESVQCFNDLFDGYINGSGKITYHDNLPDWYGMQAALHAYKKMKDKKHPNGELKLPGLQNYTDLQMFFLSHSQSWCGKGYNWDGKDHHHANAYRVIGTLSNTKAFAEAFNCSKNSPMNPEKKCNRWMKESDTP